MEPLDFKFKWVDEQGNEQGFFAKRGTFDGETLKLDDVEIPTPAMLEVINRSTRVVISVAVDEKNASLVVFNVSGGNAEKLKQALDQSRSAVWADAHRQELESQGRGHEFREELCPHCGGVINLSSMPDTPQVHCPLCDVISTLDADDKLQRAERDFKLCDECGMYSKPRKFTIFYFYFLLVVYGFWHKETWRCPGCMRGEAWKMFFGNLIFVIGVPVAIVQLLRSYGGTDIGGIHKGLDAANLKARSGKLEAAIADYNRILEEHPTAAGVMYNTGLAFLHNHDPANAARTFELALSDCGNYRPAAGALASCYEQLGETDKLAELKQRWGVVEEQDDEFQADVAPE